MKLRIAAGALGLSAMLVIPATNGFGLTQRQEGQCAAARQVLAGLQATLANLPADAVRARIKTQARIDRAQAFIAAVPCP